MAPLGLLTAVVSVIRVCGTPSMRAFIGRAQESPGTAEVELLSCTSETTAELFNEGGIARVFGEPKILEVMVRESDDDTKTNFVVGLFSDVNEPYWKKTASSQKNTDLENELTSRYHRPNLSLNVGITRLPMAVSYAAAVVGVSLQVGMLVYAALTVYTFPDTFEIEDRGRAEAYAFPLTFSGTVLVCFGLFLCAFIIERCTDEIHYKQKDSKKKSRIYWVQPGGQSIGDQVFGSYIGYSDSAHYIRSTKADQRGSEMIVLWVAIGCSMVGFVVQFVGLRSMHASVILVQIGATIIMAIIRAMLRTQRLDGMKSILKPRNTKGSRQTSNQSMQSHNPKSTYGHEMDLLALHLYNVDAITFSIDPKGKLVELTDTPSMIRQLNETSRHISWGESIHGPIEVRKRLAQLTKGFNGPAWDDLKVRQLSHRLGSAIEGAMEIFATRPPVPSFSFFLWPITVKTTMKFDLTEPTFLSDEYFVPQQNLSSGSSSTYNPSTKTFHLQIYKQDGLYWRVERDQLEAILGLWLLSILVYDTRDKTFFNRIVNSRLIWTDEVGFDTADTWYNVWIQRRSDLTLQRPHGYWIHRLPTCLIDKHTFGRLTPLESSNIPRALHVQTTNSTLEMCAQDIFMSFIYAALQDIPDIGGTTQIRDKLTRVDEAGILLQNSKVEALVDSFELNELGSREDGYMCIFPILQKLGKMPKMDSVLDAVIKQSNTYQAQNKWNDAKALLGWLYTNPGVVEQYSAAEALTELFYAAMWHTDDDVINLGFTGICKLLKEEKNPRIIPRVQEYAWVGLRIAEDKGLDSHKAELIANGVNASLVDQYTEGLSLVEWAKKNSTIMIKYLVQKDASESHLNSQDSEGLTALSWLLKHKNTEMANLLMQNKANTNIVDKDGRTPLSYASEHGLPDLLKILLEKNDVDINIRAKSSSKTALMFAAESGDVECTRLLLEEKYLIIDQRDRDGNSALHVAATNGRVELLDLLLAKGADIAAQNTLERTPLHAAAENGHHEFIKAILSHSRDVNLADRKCTTALGIASIRGDLWTVELLLQHGAGISASRGRSAVSLAAEAGQLEVIKLLIKTHRSPQYKGDWDGNISGPIRMALFGNHEDVVRYLMSDEVDPDFMASKSELAMTLLDAVESNKATMVEVVIDVSRSLDINLVAFGGSTALHVAAKNCTDVGIVDVLLEHGANPNAKDGHSSQTPLHLAAERGHTEIFRKLVKKGADIHLHDDEGYSALVHAAWNGHETIVKDILTIGELDIICYESALKWAKKAGHDQVCNLLQDMKEQTIKLEEGPN
ncbi:hypothetical protein H072_7783 [Dactylellina haptotyla CBS 200.50]|uniref:Uncharacterized protein n=1 Tax=Dactylellina haptotyla (strain CBS 200.50) TaxID=1284197 RepID=S8ABH7_DACHA|nr:hypothetical protein H072_7783 [Dactylellina haptotyla CBS 200.50]